MVKICPLFHLSHPRHIFSLILFTVIFAKDMFSESIQKQMDERKSNPNNIVVLTPMIDHEYFEKHTKKEKIRYGVQLIEGQGRF